MKRYLLVIITLFCALTVSAVRYASPYTGSGRNYVHTTIHAATPSMAQAPVASMSSTSRGFGSCGASTPIDTRTLNVVPVSCIYTAATAVRGGVTTYDEGNSNSRHIRKNGPGVPEECEHCVDDGTGHCAICGCEIDNCECDPCRCPITDGWQVWLMMGLLAAAYAVRRNRKITQQAILAV